MPRTGGPPNPFPAQAVAVGVGRRSGHDNVELVEIDSVVTPRWFRNTSSEVGNTVSFVSLSLSEGAQLAERHHRSRQ